MSSALFINSVSAPCFPAIFSRHWSFSPAYHGALFLDAQWSVLKNGDKCVVNGHLIQIWMGGDEGMQVVVARRKWVPLVPWSLKLWMVLIVTWTVWRWKPERVGFIGGGWGRGRDCGVAEKWPYNIVAWILDIVSPCGQVRSCISNVSDPSIRPSPLSRHTDSLNIIIYIYHNIN